MSAPTEGLMRLIALTKQKRDIGPMLQEYVCRKYGVENMAAFTRGAVPGVDDKESLYLQWIEWIESGELHRFTEPEVQPQEDEDEDDLLTAMLADASIAPPDPEPEAAGDGEYEDDDLAALAALVGSETSDATEEVQPESSDGWDDDPLPTEEPANPADKSMAGMTMDEDSEHADTPPDEPNSQPVEALPAESTAPDPDGERQDEMAPAAQPPVSGSIDALVLSLVRQEIAALPEPEQGVSEERIRQIVKEEIRAVLRSALG